MDAAQYSSVRVAGEGLRPSHAPRTPRGARRQRPLPALTGLDPLHVPEDASVADRHGREGMIGEVGVVRQPVVKGIGDLVSVHGER